MWNILQAHMLASIDHILIWSQARSQKGFSKFKKIEIISTIFPGHNATKLEIMYNKKTSKSTSTWRVNNTLLNKKWAIEEIRRLKKNLYISENGYTIYQHIWDAAKIVLKGKFRVTSVSNIYSRYFEMQFFSNFCSVFIYFRSFYGRIDFCSDSEFYFNS